MYFLINFDFYRLPEPGLMAEDLTENLNNPDNVVVVEWGESVVDLLPEKHNKVEIRYNDEGEMEEHRAHLSQFSANDVDDGEKCQCSPQGGEPPGAVDVAQHIGGAVRLFDKSSHSHHEDDYGIEGECCFL